MILQSFCVVVVKLFSLPIHFFLHCANYTRLWQTPLSTIRSIDLNLLAQKENSIITAFVSGKSDFKDSLIKKLLMLPSASYYQQSVSTFLYIFKLTYLTLWRYNFFFPLPLYFLLPFSYLLVICSGVVASLFTCLRLLRQFSFNFWKLSLSKPEVQLNISQL